ncbi:MAG: hypothetical protein J6I64_05500, partial [Lachnospiraceae bacterium]|nr:hypothetical protein [Lachnospiraceae bacterium]
EHDEHCSAREVVGLDGQGHIVSTFALDLGQLWSATQAWELLTGNSIVKVEPEDGLYEGLAHGCTVDEGGIDYPNPANGRVFAPYVGRELEVYVEPAKDAEIAVWKEGTVIMTHTDNEHWIRLERADGEAGWIYLEAPEVLAQSHGLTYVDYAIYDLKPLAWKYSKLPYEEIWSAMQEKALQNEPITVEVKPEGTQLSSGVLYQADLDDDGEMEQFYYAGAIHRENSRPLFIIDGKEYEIGSGFLPVIFWGSRNYLGMYYEEYYLCDIQPGDGQMEFAIGDESDASACHETDWLSFDGTWMRYIGTMDGFPFTQYQGDSEWTYKIRNGIWGLDGQGHVGTYQQMGILDKLWADVVWELNPDTGMLELMEPEDGWYINNQSRYIPFQGGYSNDNWSVYYLQNDMPLYRKPDLNAEPFVMKVQAPGYRERICLTHTDGEHWVRIENPEGESGWFYLDGWRLVLPDPKAKTVFSHYIQQVFVYRTWGEEGNQDGIVDGIDSIVIGTQAAEKYPFLQQ